MSEERTQTIGENPLMPWGEFDVRRRTLLDNRHWLDKLALTEIEDRSEFDRLVMVFNNSTDVHMYNIQVRVIACLIVVRKTLEPGVRSEEIAERWNLKVGEVNTEIQKLPYTTSQMWTPYEVIRMKDDKLDEDTMEEVLDELGEYPIEFRRSRTPRVVAALATWNALDRFNQDDVTYIYDVSQPAITKANARLKEVKKSVEQ